MQEKHLYEYSVIRLVPRVEREEFLNIGVVLYCADQDFLQARVHLNEERIKAFSPGTNILQVEEYLFAFQQICNGDSKAGPIAQWPKVERFRWLTAARSTVLQTSGVHSGFCADAYKMLEELFNELVVVSAPKTK